MTRASFLMLVLLVAPSANADIEIHKCVDADGGVAYQQTPCPIVQEKLTEKPTEIPEVAELPEQPEEIAEQEGSLLPIASNQTHDEVEACKDPLRDAIDEIEAEMLRGFSPEQSEEFKVKLRTLTQEMRACG